MPAARKASAQAQPAQEAKRERRIIQLAQDDVDRLEAIGSHIGSQAGKDLGITVELSRASVVRSLIDKAWRQLPQNQPQEPQEGAEAA